MKLNNTFLFSVILSLLSMVSISCDDDTANIGTGVMPPSDGLIVSQGAFNILTRSLAIDSVYANTNSCYLGKIIDPETNSVTTCNYLAQFHIPQNYKFPSKANMIINDKGEVEADSAEIRIFIKDFTGDSLAPMKLLVQELDTNKVMEENEKYYSNIDAEKYVNSNPNSKKTLIYTIKDLSLHDSILTSTDYYANIKIKLPKTYAQHLINSYYKNPNYFKDSYQFIHHVCPGFYFKSIGGSGVVSNVDVSVINLYFKYKTRKNKDSVEPDTIVDGFQRMAATEEVLQNTYVNSTNIKELAKDESCTYLKSPLGLVTEITLPIDSIVSGEHYTDTINSATLSLARQNNIVESEFKLQTPTEVLLVRKQNMNRFFEEDKLPDNKTSFVTSYSNSTNAYTFSNIGKLITIAKIERDLGAGITNQDTEEDRKRKYENWEKDNPDWNKVILLPVKLDYITTTSSLGISTQVIQRVRNQMGLYSTRLMKGGTEGNIKMDVIYSKFVN